MQPRDEALFAYYRQRRERKEPVNDNDLDEFERKYRESMEIVRRCMERKS